MKSLRVLSLAFVCMTVAGRVFSMPPKLETILLPNGLRVVVLEIENSKSLSAFVFLPWGLANDESGKTQWAHLVEHLIVRSTHPDDLKHANAETLGDHMRLDYYGAPEKLTEALDAVDAWLRGKPFSQQTLEREKPRVMSELDTTIPRGFTHKWAIAAWTQAYRHGARHAAIRDDILVARLDDVQKYRKALLASPGQTVICFVGNVRVQDIKPLVQKKWSDLEDLTVNPKPESSLPHRDCRVTWDVDANHLMLTWRIPPAGSPEFAHLKILGNLVTQSLFTDPQLKAMTNMSLADVDLRSPEAQFFTISTSVRAGQSSQAVKEMLLKKLQDTIDSPPVFAVFLANQLAQQLESPADPSIVQAPAGVQRWMIEGNVAVQWGSLEFRLGDKRRQIAAQTRAFNAQSLRSAGQKFLSRELCSVCTIEPR